jgi:hypothetical protein
MNGKKWIWNGCRKEIKLQRKMKKVKKERKRNITRETQKSSRNCPEAYRGKFIRLGIHMPTILYDVTTQNTAVLTLKILHCVLF